MRQLIPEHHGKPSAILRRIQASVPALAGRDFLVAG
jgi:hypothetical protein